MLKRSHNSLAFVFVHAVIFAVASFFVFGFVLPVHPVLAQATDFETLGTASGLPTSDIAILVARIIRQFLMVTGIIFTGLLIYAGYLYFTARGEPEPVKKAKKIFQQTIIGLVIIFSSYSIVTFILNRLLDAAFTGTSQSIADTYSEPLSGSLGAGILDDHYPERDATEIPRNTRIFVTFKEAIDPTTMIDGYVEGATSGNLNVASVLIYPTEEGTSSALAADKVEVTLDNTLEIFVFNPVDYLGNAQTDTNYTVVLTTNIQKADGDPAFSGAYASGYNWQFEVSTEIDLTPPYVTSVVPVQNAAEPRNVTIEVNFNEPMDPVAGTGTYYIDPVKSSLSDLSELFTNISALYDLDGTSTFVEGTWEISNGYRTIDFTTTDACGEDPCGDKIYCLPGLEAISVTAKAASVDANEIPQGIPASASFDGLVDAASNSLDGDNDGDACGSNLDTIVCADGDDADTVADEDDDYDWNFTTTDDILDTVPQVFTLNPDISEGEINQTDDLIVEFNTFLKSSTVDSTSVSLWPDPWYEMWFAIRKNNTTSATQVLIEHPTLVSNDVGGWNYWPVLTQDIKSAYQICMYPAIDQGSNCSESRNSDFPYCCGGIQSDSACKTTSGDTLPDNSPP